MYHEKIYYILFVASCVVVFVNGTPKLIRMEKMTKVESKVKFLDMTRTKIRPEEVLLTSIKKEFGFNENKNKESKASMDNMKCECAQSIYAVLDAIHYYLSNCSKEKFESQSIAHGGEQNSTEQHRMNQQCLNEISAVPHLESLNQLVKLSIAKILDFSDAAPNTKFSETIFLKALLMLNIYIDSLSNKEYRNERNNRKKSKIDVEFQTVKQNESDTNSVDEKLSDLNKLQRVILQVMNLIERFTIGNCPVGILSGPKNINESNENMEIIAGEQLNDLKNVLIKYSSILPNSFLRFDMNDVLLKECIKNPNETNDVCFITAYLRKSDILNHDNNWVSIRDYLEKVEYTDNVDHIHAYLKTVFEIIMKIVYEKTLVFLVKRQQLDPKFCKDILFRLKSLNFPVEMVNHFQLLANMMENWDKFDDSSKNNFINESIVPKLNNFTQTYLLQQSKNIPLVSLSILMDDILDDKFKQFWRIFNFLDYESTKNSKYLYSVTLKLFHENFVFDPLKKYKSDFVCNELTKMYYNFFFIEFKMNKCKPMKTKEEFSGLKNCVLEVRGLYKQFANNLLQYLNIWNSSDILMDDYDLLNIFLTAIIHLKNDKNTVMTGEKNNDENGVKQWITEETINRIKEKLKKIGDFLMNLLDNYQIRHCEKIENRHFVYENMCRNKFDPNSDILSLTLPPNCEITARSNQDITAFSVTGGKIPKNFYDFDLLTGSNILYIKFLTNYGTGIFFNWYGETKSIYEILQTDIISNMLDTYYLIDFQKTFLKWFSAVYYTLWFTIIENTIENSSLVKNDIKDLVDNMEKFNNIFFPHLYSYRDIVNDHWQFLINLSLNSNDKKNVVSAFRKTFVDPVMEIIFGVVHVNLMTLEEIKTIFDTESDDELNNLCGNLLHFENKNWDLFSKYLFFLKSINF